MTSNFELTLLFYRQPRLKAESSRAKRILPLCCSLNDREEVVVSTKSKLYGSLNAALAKSLFNGGNVSAKLLGRDLTVLW